MNHLLKTFILLLLIFLYQQNGFTGSNQWTTCTNVVAYSIAVSPSDPNVIYVSGGDFFGDYTKLYRSTDQGNTWSYITNFGNFIRSIAIDPYSSSTIYIGTQSLKLFKSIDGGTTFYSSSSGLIASGGYPIWIDPIESNVLYEGSGFSKSTDYGQSWITLTTDMILGVGPLAIDPVNRQILYCATNNSKVFKSLNGGLSWTIKTTGLNDNSPIYKGLTIDPTNSQIIYLANSTPYMGFYKSTTGGDFWFLMDSGLDNQSPSGLLMDPGNSNILYVSTQGDGVFRSLDGASTWSEFNNVNTNGIVTFNLGLSVASLTTLFVVGEGVHCYSFTDTTTNVPDSHWKQLDSKILTKPDSLIEPSSFATLPLKSYIKK